MDRKKLFRIVELIFPPLKWQIPVAMALGGLSGLGIYILHISKATSYMQNDPKVCINCHIMTPQYMTWEKSSHHRVATCNECHTPQDNILNQYFFKAKDGLRHSFMFTFRMEPAVIRIHEAGRKVVQENCLRCHGNFLSYNDLHKSLEKRSCVECHREVPHGRIKGLSSTPNALVPLTGPMVPEWLRSQQE